MKHFPPDFPGASGLVRVVLDNSELLFSDKFELIERRVIDIENGMHRLCILLGTVEEVCAVFSIDSSELLACRSESSYIFCPFLQRRMMDKKKRPTKGRCVPCFRPERVDSGVEMDFALLVFPCSFFV